MPTSDPTLGWLERLAAQAQSARTSIGQAGGYVAEPERVAGFNWQPRPATSLGAQPATSTPRRSYGGGVSATPANLAALGLSPAEAWIIQRESGGRTTARNPKAVISNGHNLGHAFGLGQLVDTNRQNFARMLGIANPDTTDAGEQLAMFRAYVKGRYGSAEKAQAFWRAHGWY